MTSLLNLLVAIHPVNVRPEPQYPHDRHVNQHEIDLVLIQNSLGNSDDDKYQGGNHADQYAIQKN
jgi:hypothetical protein